MGKLFNAVSFKYSFGSTRVITDFEGMVSSSTKFSLVDTSLNLKITISTLYSSIILFSSLALIIKLLNVMSKNKYFIKGH
ncbi:MAG: hypothetical protein CM15mP76_03320 [Prochlorococcus sp.]|nr:MAG: hypothetical protein CM15mP76_03320 [Prochlorococcus sp.]